MDPFDLYRPVHPRDAVPLDFRDADHVELQIGKPIRVDWQKRRLRILKGRARLTQLQLQMAQAEDEIAKLERTLDDLGESLPGYGHGGARFVGICACQRPMPADEPAHLVVLTTGGSLRLCGREFRPDSQGQLYCAEHLDHDLDVQTKAASLQQVPPDEIPF